MSKASSDTRQLMKSEYTKKIQPRSQAIKQIPILSVIQKLWLEYERAGNVYKILQWGKLTSWRTIYSNKSNRVHDHSKDRPEWNTFEFIRAYHWRSDNKTWNAKTYKRFEDNFTL
jgi:hypothetical protein